MRYPLGKYEKEFIRSKTGKRPEEITLDDLCGKQIAIPMMGAVPDWTMQMVLKKHGLSFAVVE